MSINSATGIINNCADISEKNSVINNNINSGIFLDGNEIQQLEQTFLEKKCRLKYDIDFWLSTINDLTNFIEKVKNDTISPESVYQTGLTLLISVFEEAVEAFPTFGKLWRLYAETLNKHSGRPNALAAYKRAMNQTRSLELFISYVKFIYNDGLLFPLLDALTTAVHFIGTDIRSRPLWRELLALRIKLHNARNISQGQLQSLTGTIVDPFLSIENTSNANENHRLFTDDQLNLLISATQDLLCTAPLMNSSEQDVRSQFLQGSNKDLSNRFTNEQSFDKVRLVYRNWLSTPTSGLSIVAEGYTQFEKVLNTASCTSHRTTGLTASRVLTNRMLSSATTIVTASQEAYKMLQSPQMFGGFKSESGTFGSVESPAIPSSKERFLELKGLTRRWLKILAYEQTNPINLSPDLLHHRIESVFEFCLASCGFQTLLWVMYFQVLLRYDQRSKGKMFIDGTIPFDTFITLAIVCLQRAVDRFLPNDELLQLILADLLHQQGAKQPAFQILVSIILNSISIKQRPMFRFALIPIMKQTGLSIEDNKEIHMLPFIHSTHTNEIIVTSDDTDYSHSVAFLHFFKFLRVVCGLTKAHNAFLALHHFGPKELYIYHAEILWRISGNAIAATEVLAMGDSRFRTDIDFISQRSSLLLQMGYIDESKRHLFIATSLLYQKTGEPPYSIWSQLFELESKFGSNSQQLRKRWELILSQQINGIDSDERMLLGADSFISSISHATKTHPHTILTDPFTIPLIQPSSSLTNSLHNLPGDSPITISLGQAANAGVKEGEIKDIIQSSFETRCRMYKCGLGIRELFHSMSFGTSVPQTSLSLWWSDKQRDRNCHQYSYQETPEWESDTEIDIIQNKDITHHQESEYFSIMNNELLVLEVPSKRDRQLPMIRPDTSKMIPFNPLTVSPSIQLPGLSQLSVISDLPLPLPKGIQELVCLLPNMPQHESIQQDMTSTRVIDYLLASLKDMSIPNVTLSDYHPMTLPNYHPKSLNSSQPIQQILHSSHSNDPLSQHHTNNSIKIMSGEDLEKNNSASLWKRARRSMY